MPPTKTAHDYAARIKTLLQECGTIYERYGCASEDSASVDCVVAVYSDGGEWPLVRVADGVGSEWFGDIAECLLAVTRLSDAESWQDGWDALGDGVNEPEQWEYA